VEGVLPDISRDYRKNERVWNFETVSQGSVDAEARQLLAEVLRGMSEG
jgi:hypothetical protein